MGMFKQLFSYEYIHKEHLQGLDKYKYSCVDTSPVSKYVMQPFWSAIVNLYPRWLAPNVLTFVGFMCLILQSFMFSIYDYSFYGYCFDRAHCNDESLANLTANQLNFQENLKSFDMVPSNVCSCIPRWLFLLIAVCQFLSHHLDGTDGKQARRTNSSSPLGELFDHGLDSWATLFLPVALFSIFGRNGDFGLTAASMYGILWLILATFIISHWEKYNTGILFLPWSYDLSQVGMTVLFFLTSIFGQEVWFFRLSFFGNLPSTKVIEVIIYVFSLGLSLPFSIYNMYLASVNNTFKQESIYEAVRPLFSTIYLFVIQWIWIEYSPSNIMELEPRAFFWLTGTLFSNISCRLIVAQMTSTRCNIFNIGLIPLTLVVGLFTIPFSGPLAVMLTKQAEVYTLYSMVVLVTLLHVHYGICMVRQICKHLNIYCFVITSKPAAINKMVNSYALNSRQQQAKPVLLGQSNALKKFEKFQNKYTPGMAGKTVKKSEKKPKKKRHILDTTDEDDDSEPDEEDSVFKNANRFMKKKPVEAEPSVKDDSDDSDIELSIMDRSSTPKRLNRKASIINRSNNSSVNSVRSASYTHRRSQSKVKFVNDYSDNDDETIIDDMLSKNLVLDIDELEAATPTPSFKYNKKKSHKRMSKSPLAMAAHKRSESVTSIQEESILQSSVNDEPSLLETNLILDINELEKSISKLEKKSRRRKESETSSRPKKSDRKGRRDQKTMSSSITTFLDQTETEDQSIVTESISDSDNDEIKTVNSEITEQYQTSYKATSLKYKDISQSYFDDFETSTTKSPKKHSKRDKHKSPRTPRTQKSYTADFNETTEFDADFTTPRQRTPHRKLSFHDTKPRPKSTATAGCQCDPHDLLKNSNMLNTVNVYNPSSILLATTSHLNDNRTLNDLNQMTGYTMINQAFNDILKVNVNFVKNFLSAQRSLYEQQISSIRPKPMDF